MSRRREVPKRRILPDPKYGDRLVAKFCNVLMLNGKKSLAEKIIYTAFDNMAAKNSDEEPLKTFKKALDNVKPLVEVKSRRVGGATYQVPNEVRPQRGTALAMRWLITCSRARSEVTMEARLAGELMDAAANRGAAVKKREQTHSMAEANKPYSHLNWN